MTDALVPVLPPRVPRRHARWLQRVGRWAFTRAGWRVEGNFPDVPRQVLVIAPHTSNWDFVAGLGAMLALDLDPRWLGKHTLFRPPLGWLMRAIGGIPVRRDTHHDMVAQVVDAFRAARAMVLAITPEGTRRKTAAWKTGYYAIAEQAGVPVVPVWFDWGRRVVGIGAPYAAEGGAAALTERLRGLYHAGMARRPSAF